MCGVAGILSLAGDARGFDAAVRRMTGLQAHRGPDAEGFYVDDCIALGHRRLAIVDLSELAGQPMASYDGRYVLAFNGEIYNFRELRARFPDYRYRTESDTEVVLAVFAAEGEQAISLLKGQFAIALWDSRERRLLLARDRLGEKPLYYHVAGSRVAFASEMRALLAAGTFRAELSLGGLRDYLVQEAVPTPGTIVKDVRQLPPGHYAWVDRGGMRIAPYWAPRAERPTQRSDDYAATCRRVRELLGAAVAGQLVADVPVGAFLSGGIDSSAVVALMAERSAAPVTTLSVTFDEGGFDESQFAALVARRFATDHREVRLRPAQFLNSLPSYFDHLDVPSGDGANTYVVARAAREAGLTVALSGLGGDELFAGYRAFTWYHAYMRHARLWELPVGLRTTLARGLQRLRRDVNGGKLIELAALPPRDLGAFYSLVRRAFPPAAVIRLLGVTTSPAAGADGFPGREPSPAPDAMPLLSQYSVMELTRYMRDVLLRDSDALSMASSLEVRVPFLDHDLVEYVLSVPDEFKYPHRPKRLLVDALGDLLPVEVIDRPKMGFSLPWDQWLRSELRPVCEESLRVLGTSGVLDGGAVAGLWADYIARRPGSTWNQVWLLVTLGQWLKRVRL